MLFRLHQQLLESEILLVIAKLTVYSREIRFTYLFHCAFRSKFTPKSTRISEVTMNLIGQNHTSALLWTNEKSFYINEPA